MRRPMRLFAATAIAVGVLVSAGPVGAQGNPYVVAWIGGGSVVGLPEQFISGQDYVADEEIDLFINGVHQATAIAQPNDEGTASPLFPIGFQAGDEIALVRSDGTEQTLIAHAIAVGSANATTDTVTGSAEPGSEVLVLIGFSGEFARYETADPSTTFSADFSVVGERPDEQNTLDLEPRTIGAALQVDEYGNVTAFFFTAEAGVTTPTSKDDCKKGGWQDLTAQFSRGI